MLARLNGQTRNAAQGLQRFQAWRAEQFQATGSALEIRAYAVEFDGISFDIRFPQHGELTLRRADLGQLRIVAGEASQRLQDALTPCCPACLSLLASSQRVARPVNHGNGNDIRSRDPARHNRNAVALLSQRDGATRDDEAFGLCSNDQRLPARLLDEMNAADRLPGCDAIA